MFITQKNHTGVWYLVERITDPKTGRKKQVWKTTGTRDKAKAQTIADEIEASRKLALNKGTEKQDTARLIMERALATSELIHGKSETPLETVWALYLDNAQTRDLKESSLARVRSAWTQFNLFCKANGITSAEQITWQIADAYLFTLLETQSRFYSMSRSKILVKPRWMQGYHEFCKPYFFLKRGECEESGNRTPRSQNPEILSSTQQETRRALF